VATDGLTVARANANPDPALATSHFPPSPFISVDLANFVIHWQLANGFGFNWSNS